MVKNSPAGDLGSFPGLGRSPRKGNSYPLQYSCLENSMEEESMEEGYSPLGHKDLNMTMCQI